MDSELDRELVELQAELRRRQKLQKDLAAAQASLRWKATRLATLAAALARESADVQRLEGLSLQALFYTLLGSKEEQLQKERQEHLMARLEHDECRDAVAALEREVRDLQAQLAALGDLDARYTALLARREAALRTESAEDAARLDALAGELANATADARELAEAIAAGNAALGGLDEVVNALESASGWGVWDLLGGGTLTTLVKHSRLDDARAAAHRVQQLLRRFQRELADVAASEPGLTVDVGSFATFADFFFDGLIADWVVQSRMERALQSAASVRDSVRRTVRRLEGQLAAARRRASELEAERRRLLES